MKWLLSASFSMMLSSLLSSSLMRMDFEFSFSLLRSSLPRLRLMMAIAFLRRWPMHYSILLRLSLFSRLARAGLSEWLLSLLCQFWLF